MFKKMFLTIIFTLNCLSVAYSHGNGHTKHDYHVYLWHDHLDENPGISTGSNYHWHLTPETEASSLMHAFGTGTFEMNGETTNIKNPLLDNNGEQINQVLIRHTDDGKDQSGTRYDAVAKASNHHIRIDLYHTTMNTHVFSPVHGGGATRQETITHKHDKSEEHTHTKPIIHMVVYTSQY